jgi:3-oxoacyl-[acyl-carrier protein] reductase
MSNNVPVNLDNEMNLGINGRKAIVCAASKGLGRACAFSLARNGVELVIIARTAETLEMTADEIRRESGVRVTAIAADITTNEGRAAALSVCPEPDILVNNAGGPPPGDFREWSREDWIKGLDANMLTPIELIKATVDGMMTRGFGRIVNITSSAVKAPIDILGLSNGARSGLTGFVAGIARKTVRKNVTINNLLPGPFDTDRLRATLRAAAQASGRTSEEVAEERKRANPAGRFGDPSEFGDACAYLCSAQAGFITGQNLLLDGGAYPGTF